MEHSRKRHRSHKALVDAEEEVIPKTNITNSDVCRTAKVPQVTQVNDNDNSLNKEAKFTHVDHGAVNPRCRVRAERLPGFRSPHFLYGRLPLHNHREVTVAAK